MMQEECRERQEGEIEFVKSAYTEEEAWCETPESKDSPFVIHRKVILSASEDDTTTTATALCLSLYLPLHYPIESSLEVTGRLLEESQSTRKCSVVLRKAAYDQALPAILQAAEAVAAESVGDESVFLVFSRIDEWIQEEWPSMVKTILEEKRPATTNASNPNTNDGPLVLGRRLIYSHHIISKIKRGDIKKLAADYDLTGYMKIGWPGLLIVEGLEEDCIAFYDDIRRWNWQYLVVRGEQQEQLSTKTSNAATTKMDLLQTKRKFQSFQEVEDMSLVARHCREVGLENLFKSSMKVYDNAGESDITTESDGTSYLRFGALVHVDHMNDAKGYRKWLRKTSQETQCQLVLKQCYPNDDYCKRPMILVGILGLSASHVSAFLKRWRTSKVDVDSRGRPCLERQMKVLLEAPLDKCPNDEVDWDRTMAEEHVTLSQDLLLQLLSNVGGEEWTQAFSLQAPWLSTGT